MMPVEILVVDDEPDLALLIRQKFRKRIRENEWKFHFAHNGFEALEALNEHPDISLMLTDINMPGMDGLALLDRIADLDLTLKSVVVSAYGDMSNIRVAMNRGAFDFITKPVDFDDLEITIRKTLREVFAYRDALKSQNQLVELQRELSVARRIQEAFIPEHSFSRDAASLGGYLEPAREVGGDFYDFFMLDDRRLGLVIGDVSGKGVSAALFMAITRSLLHATALKGDPPHECLSFVNRLLYPQSLAEVFVTALYGILDIDTGAFTYTTAGHFPPIRIDRQGHVESLPRIPGVALAMTANFDYASQTVQLQAGDGLFFFTDGATEAARSSGEQFSDDRLVETLEKTGGFTALERIGAVVQDIEEFVKGALQSDDITLLAINYQQ